MDFLRNKTILGSTLLVIVALLTYNFFLKGNSIVPTEGENQVGSDLIQISEELSGASFNQELFSEPAYRFLTDFSTPIPAQVVGRTNPFDIIGRD